VPAQTLSRANAVQPEAVLQAPFWRSLTRARDLRLPRSAFAPIRTRIAELEPAAARRPAAVASDPAPSDV
jgi:hypothetical protein